MTRKKTIVNNFQLDDTFDGHACLCSRLSRFIEQNKDANLFAAVESTGGYENNWFELLVRLQKSIPIQAARLNPLGVHANSKANLQRIITDQISAKNVAEYMVAHPEKTTYQAPDGWAGECIYIYLYINQHVRMDCSLPLPFSGEVLLLSDLSNNLKIYQNY